MRKTKNHPSAVRALFALWSLGATVAELRADPSLRATASHEAGCCCRACLGRDALAVLQMHLPAVDFLTADVADQLVRPGDLRQQWTRRQVQKPAGRRAR